MHHRRCLDHDDDDDVFSHYEHAYEIEMANKTALLPGDSEIDQIHKIFRLFGTPSESQWTELCLLPFWRNNFPQWEPLAWNIIVPRLSRDATDLLSVRHHYHYDHDRYPEVDHLYIHDHHALQYHYHHAHHYHPVHRHFAHHRRRHQNSHHYHRMDITLIC